MCALGQLAHMPVIRTSAELPVTSTSSMSPPSACMNGRTRLRTASTRSLEIMPTRRATDVPEVRCRISGDLRLFGDFEAGRPGIIPRTGEFPRCRRSGRGGTFELEFLDPIADLIPIEAEQTRRARLIPAAALERLHDERSFELLQ